MFIIDRFEEEWAVIETYNQSTFSLPRQILPSSAKEGDVLNISISVNREATKQRHDQIEKILNEFFDK